jgi:hypothetical protein
MSLGFKIDFSLKNIKHGVEAPIIGPTLRQKKSIVVHTSSSAMIG